MERLTQEEALNCSKADKLRRGLLSEAALSVYP